MSDILLDAVLCNADRGEAYYQLVDFYLNSSSEARNQIRSRWDFAKTWEFPSPYRLACAERHSTEDRALALLVYDALEDFKAEELKEKLIAWALVYNSCLLVHLDPVPLFKKVASVSSSRVCEEMNKFISRSDVDKSMDAFMLVLSKGDNGDLILAPSWHKLPS